MDRPSLLASSNQQLVRLAASWGVWVTSECASLVVVSVVAYAEGGLAAVGLAGAARVLPSAFASPWAAVITDRFPRVHVLASLHALCALQLIVLSAVALVHLPLLVLYAAVVLGAVLSGVVRPTTSALVPQVVRSSQQLTGANAMCSTMEAAGTLAGPALAGLLLVVVVPPVAFLAVALLSVAGALATVGITPTSAPVGAPAGRRAGQLRDLVAGFECLMRESRVRAIFGLFMAQGVMRGLLNVFVVAAAVSLLGLGESGSSSLLSVIGLGGLLGAGLSFRMDARRRLALPFAGGVAAWGLAVLVIGAWPNPAGAWVVLGALGLGNAVEDVAGLTLMQRLVPERQLGRAFGAFWGTAGASVAAGSLAAPVLIGVFGLRGAMLVSGVLLVLLVAALWGQVRQADHLVDAGAQASWSSASAIAASSASPRPASRAAAQSSSLRLAALAVATLRSVSASSGAASGAAMAWRRAAAAGGRSYPNWRWGEWSSPTRRGARTAAA